MRIHKLRFDYRHIICITITLDFFCFWFRFPNAFGRLVESFRDLGLSIAFYFCELLEIPHSITPSVNGLPNIVIKLPFSFPDNFEQFKQKFVAYWRLWASKDNLLKYFVSLQGFLKILVLLLPFLMLLFIALRIAVSRYTKKFNNDYAAESRPLRVFKRVCDKTYRPIKKWFVDLFEFIASHKVYYITWLLTWLLWFNAYTIVIEFLAFYFYFVVSFDFINIYRQLYKLILDLSSVIFFVPLLAWLILAVFVLQKLSVARGYANLRHRERRNRGFLNERGICSCIYGYIGSGKTKMLTDAALSYEAQFLDDALEIIIETDMHFPNFPWINLENELKAAMDNDEVYDIWSCRRWLKEKRKLWELENTVENIFGYDYERYSLFYNDNLKVIDIWEALSDYVCAYFIYTVQSSYIISNYSIRSDKLISDVGNFPLWNTDFFSRDSRLLDSFSRHAHILDFDMLRLGKKMLENNPNRNAFGFGVYVVTEIDKERKNSPELMEVKRNAVECNQKNDLFNSCLKISRHACVVANRVFVRIITDLQRTGSLNSDMVELGDKIELRESGDMALVLPFWSPFWLADLLCSLVFGKFNDFYLNYRYIRADNTLFMYVVKTITAKLANYRERIYNLFGSQKVNVRVARGLADGTYKNSVYFIQSKKIYSRRYSTDCASAIFEARGELNTVGIDDLSEYADIMATNAERNQQHSHFQNEINVLSGVEND